LVITQRYPLVSLITAVYNQASYLDETIQSILDQDYPNIEYIVIDDGSTDNSLGVIKKYGDRVKWDAHPNMGETRTVNKGFSMATGSIIGVISSDDPLLPGAIKKIVEHMIADPDIIVAYPDWKMIDNDSNTIRHIKVHKYSYMNMVRWHQCLPGPGTFFLKEVVQKTGGRDIAFRYVGDFDFWLRAGLLGKFCRVPEVLATYRVHLNSATMNQRNASMGEEHIRLIQKIYSTPGLPVDIVAVKNEAYSSACYHAGVMCGNDFNTTIKYFKSALIYAPAKYLTEYRVRLFIMFIYILMCVKPFSKPLTRLKTRYQRIRGKFTSGITT
jgi:glycosyltransferase involved in cell wall biosynthesis